MTYALHDIPPGLTNPVMDSQVMFRALLHAMSRPGTILVPGAIKGADSPLAPPAPLSPAAAAVCLTLADLDTPVWLEHGMPQPLRTYLRFHCGCPLTDDPGTASFGIITDGNRLPDMDLFSRGDQDYPDRSATLIVQVQSFEPGTGVRLSGPGILGEAFVNILGLSPSFWVAFAANHTFFPRGWDVIFATDDEILCLPRTTRVEV